MLKPQEVINDRYKVEKLLGQGGMGKVYLADDYRENQKVAIKVIHLDPGDSYLRFKREFRVMSRLKHSHVVHTIESGQHNEKPFLVMAYLSGGSLEDRYEGGCKNVAETIERLELIIQVCDALNYIHSQSIIHRDLKPENIMLEPNKDGKDRVFLMDFGLAKQTFQETMALTQAGAVVGTVAYMSPEQAQGGSLDARSDLYSLGCILYWMLIGEAPLLGNTFVETLLKKMREFAAPPSLYKEFIPHELDAVVLKLLAKNPADRYSTAADVIQDLKNIKIQFSKQLSSTHISLSEDELHTIDKPVSKDVTLAQLFHAPLIEREDIWQKLCLASQRLIQGKGDIFIIKADMGMGLSRLLTEFRRETRSHGNRVIQFQHRQGINAPYQAWKGALKTFRSQHPSDFIKASQGLESDLAILLPELSGKDIDYDLPADVMQLRLYDAVDRFLDRLAEQSSLVLLIDNLHLADEGTIGLFNYLSRGASKQKLLMVIALHNNQASSSILKTLKNIEAENCTLSPLSNEAMGELVIALLGGEVEKKLISYVIERAVGNPFFAQEILTSLLKNKHIKRRAGFWEWRGGRTSIPAGIEGVLMQNLERLSERAQKVASVASAIGRQFDFELLKTLLQIDEDDLLDDLDELLRAKIIEEFSEEQYRFSHLILREALHEKMMVRRKNNYHQKIADILSKQEDVAPEVLADHYAETKEPIKAFPYALAAARAAEKIFANDITEQYYRLAIKVLPKDNSQLPELKLSLGQVLERVGKWTEAEKLYKELEQIESYRPRAHHRLGCLAQKQGNLNTSEKYLRQALFESSTKLAVYSDLGRTLAHRSELDSARNVLQEALELAQSFELTAKMKNKVIARAQIDLGTLEYQSGNSSAAIKWLSIAKTNIDENNNKALLAKINNIMGLTYQNLGKFDLAEECFEVAKGLYMAIGDAERVLTVTQNLGNNAILLGEEQKALEILAQVKKKAYRLGEDRLKTIATSMQGDLFLSQGRFDKAKEYLQEAYQASQSLGFVHIEVHTRLSLCKCLVRSRQLIAASEQLSATKKLLNQFPHPYYEAFWQMCLGEVVLYKGELATALKELKLASEFLVKAQADPEDMISVNLLQAVTLLKLKELEPCQQMLIKATQIANNISKPRLKLHITYLQALCSNKQPEQSEILELQAELRENGLDYLMELL